MKAQQEFEAFVAAIAAAPTDDTARLAFADWLQEHGRDEYNEHLLAEFLRLECQLAAAYNRLKALRYQLGGGWVEHVQACRDVVLHSFPPGPDHSYRHAVVRLLRQHAGLSLAQARETARQLPATILRNVPIARAIRIAEEFGEVATVSLVLAAPTTSSPE